MNTAAPDIDTKVTSRKYTRRSEAQWRQLIAHFEQSDLTLEAYCQHHKIAPSRFYTCRKRFESESGENAPAETLIDITPQFSPQASTTRSSNSTSWQVELELGHGCVLRIKTA